MADNDFTRRLAELHELRDAARDELPALADAVRANPDDAEAKARYREAQDTIAAFRAFERGGSPGDYAGNMIGGVRGIAVQNDTEPEA